MNTHSVLHVGSGHAAVRQAAVKFKGRDEVDPMVKMRQERTYLETLEKFDQILSQPYKFTSIKGDCLDMEGTIQASNGKTYTFRLKPTSSSLEELKTRIPGGGISLYLTEKDNPKNKISYSNQYLAERKTTIMLEAAEESVNSGQGMSSYGAPGNFYPGLEAASLVFYDKFKQNAERYNDFRDVLRSLSGLMTNRKGYNLKETKQTEKGTEYSLISRNDNQPYGLIVGPDKRFTRTFYGSEMGWLQINGTPKEFTVVGKADGSDRHKQFEIPSSVLSDEDIKSLRKIGKSLEATVAKDVEINHDEENMVDLTGSLGSILFNMGDRIKEVKPTEDGTGYLVKCNRNSGEMTVSWNEPAEGQPEVISVDLGYRKVTVSIPGQKQPPTFESLQILPKKQGYQEEGKETKAPEPVVINYGKLETAQSRTAARVGARVIQNLKRQVQMHLKLNAAQADLGKLQARMPRSR